MREIKFRAWDEVNKEMFKVKFMEWEQRGEKLVAPNSVDKIMQFTGLIDKNGKEIYEGDILADRYDNGKFCNLSVIKWENHCTDGECYCEMFGWMIPTTTYNNSGLEVIGNIYETPEIIKQSS